jgi:spore germination cell wall hydrolase CwlJ-like protein
VWEEVSVEGKLIIAETYLNHLEVNIFLESLLGSCSQRAPSGPFSLACYYMLKLTA